MLAYVVPATWVVVACSTTNVTNVYVSAPDGGDAGGGSSDAAGADASASETGDGAPKDTGSGHDGPIPSRISVDIWNPALNGPNAPNLAARRGAAPNAIAARAAAADIICLVEVDEDGDKNAILKAATNTTGGSGPYSYVYLPKTDLGTPFTNPAAQNGQVPPASTTPPCNGVDPGLINAALSCGEQNCSTLTGDPTGTLKSSTDCLVSNCAAAFLGVQGASVACYDCIVVYVASDASWQTTQNNCTTDVRPPLGFSGAMNSMILSNYTLNNTDVLILPSTFYRRSVLYGQVQLENQSVDFYCGLLSTTLNASALPYNGNYGGSAAAGDSQTAWNNEQAFQAQQLASWVQKKSGTNPAIVVGDWRSSIGVSVDAGVTAPPGAFLPDALNPATMLVLSGASWTFAAAPAPWGAQCNFCPQQENSYNLSSSYFVSQPILVNWPNPLGATTAESLIYTQGVVGTSDAGLGPLSPYYGVNVTVTRPH